MSAREGLIAIRLMDKDNFIDLGLKSPVRPDGSLDKWQVAVLFLTLLAVLAMFVFTAQNMFLIMDKIGCQGCLEKYCPFNLTEMNYCATNFSTEGGVLKPIASTQENG